MPKAPTPYPVRKRTRDELEKKRLAHEANAGRQLRYAAEEEARAKSTAKLAVRGSATAAKKQRLGVQRYIDQAMVHARKAATLHAYIEQLRD